jgi:probable HAF family extracellular repeat protein
MKNLNCSISVPEAILSVGFLCLLLLSAARGQTSYTLTDLGILGGDGSSFNFFGGINNRGQVVGQSATSGDVVHAFLYSDGQMIDLGTLGGSESFASGINDRGQVVGSSSIAGDTATHAFLYSDGQMQDLNNLLAPNSGWIVKEATGINDRGQIAGFGTLNGGPFRALLLTPVRPVQP